MRELNELEVQAVNGGNGYIAIAAGVAAVVLIGVFCLAVLGARRNSQSESGTVIVIEHKPEPAPADTTKTPTPSTA